MESVLGAAATGMWKPLIVMFAVALGLSAGLILILRPAFARYAMARPNARSSHFTRPRTSLLGRPSV